VIQSKSRGSYAIRNTDEEEEGRRMGAKKKKNHRVGSEFGSRTSTCCETKQDIRMVGMIPGQRQVGLFGEHGFGDQRHPGMERNHAQDEKAEGGDEVI
jgi:hypothetical protein